MQLKLIYYSPKDENTVHNGNYERLRQLLSKHFITNVTFRDDIASYLERVGSANPVLLFVELFRVEESQSCESQLTTLKHQFPDLFITLLCHFEPPFTLVDLINKGYVYAIIPTDMDNDSLKPKLLFLIRRATKEFESRTTLEELQERLWKLNQIGIALSVEHNIDSLLDKILFESRQLTHCDAGSLYIVKDDMLSFEVAHNDTLATKKSNISKDESFKAFKIPLSKQSIAGFCALTGEPLNIFDAHNLPPSLPFSFDKSFDEKSGYRTKSMLVVPMKDDQDKVIGVIQLINALSREGDIITFSPLHEEIVMSLASQAAITLRNSKLLQDVRHLLSSIIEFSSSIIDARSTYTAGHSKRITELALNLAKAINADQEGHFREVTFTEDQLEELTFAAFLHDIGKIGIPEHILDKKEKIPPERLELIKTRLLLALHQEKNGETGDLRISKPLSSRSGSQLTIDDLPQLYELLDCCNNPGPLPATAAEQLEILSKMSVTTPHGHLLPVLDEDSKRRLLIRRGNLTEKERREIERHVEYTATLLEHIPFPPHLSSVPEIASDHHEKINGSGYPRGKRGEELSLQAKILGVADFFDALTAMDRPYKKPVPPEKTIEIMKEEAMKGAFDPHIVELLENPDIYSEVITKQKKTRTDLFQ